MTLRCSLRLGALAALLLTVQTCAIAPPLAHAQAPTAPAIDSLRTCNTTWPGGAASCLPTVRLTAAPAPTPAPTPAPAPTPVPMPPPAPSGLYARMPAGYARIAESGFSAALATNGWSASGVAGCWYRYSTLVLPASDASAPISPPGVLSYTWPKGLPVGTSAGMFGGWDGCSAKTEYRGVYESGWVKLVGSTFEAPAAGMKLLGFWSVGEAATGKAGNQIHAQISGGIRSAFMLDIRQQGPFARSMVPNRSTAPLIVVGRWVRYELLMTLNEIGKANGTLTVWIDGTVTHDYRDVTWRTAAAPSGFYGRLWDPTWGGTGQPPAKTRADVMLVDHVYISGLK